MKNKYIVIIPSLIILILFTIANYKNIKKYYDEVLEYTGYYSYDFETELLKENIKAHEDEEKYQNILISLEKENSFDEEIDENNIEKLRLNSKSALLLDAENNRVLYELNGLKKMPMASTTKIMTCIVTLENANLSDIVTVSSYAAKMPDVQLNIHSDEQYYLKDLLYSLMLESHNDVAVAIAEHVGGSVEGFATMMNDKARLLKCYDTNFVTPNGLDAEGHYTTAVDLAKISSYAIKNQQFIDITNTTSYNFSEITKGRNFTVTNKNKFLYMMEDAIGIKTGFTSKAGYCFVGAVKKTDKTFISVVLGCGWPPSKSLKWTDTKRLMNYGIDNYNLKQIFEPAQFEPIYVEDGQIKYEALTIKGDICLLMRDEEKVHIHYDIPKVLHAPIEMNQIVGYAQYYINGMLYDEIPIHALEKIKKEDYPFCINKLIKLWSLQYSHSKTEEAH